MESKKKKKRGKTTKRVRRRKSGSAGVRGHLDRKERVEEEMNRLWEGELLLTFRWQSERAFNRIIGQI